MALFVAWLRSNNGATTMVCSHRFVHGATAYLSVPFASFIAQLCLSIILSLHVYEPQMLTKTVNLFQSIITFYCGHKAIFRVLELGPKSNIKLHATFMLVGSFLSSEMHRWRACAFRGEELHLQWVNFQIPHPSPLWQFGA